MAQWGFLKQSTNKRCELMWNFLREIPNWLAQKVPAWIGREAHADAMYRGSSPSRNTHQADRSASAINPLFVCLIGVGTLNPMIVVFAAERCPATNATKVVSVQGNVTWNVINNATLTPAKLNDLLCVGDTVQVGAKSRAVLRLPNQTTVPLDQNTIFRLKEAISDKEPTLIELIQGAIHVITRTPKPFKVDTPYLNALVEGTEFYVGVDNQETRVAVIEGKVNVSNEQGAVLLTDNEAASARKGQAPQKTLTIKPRDAVQWALYYPPLFDPRSRSESQSLANAHALYSQGKITDAIESLDAIPETERNGDFYSYKAGLLLLVGRADEAEPDIETALADNGNNTDALSLKAIIAIVKNDKAKALELANQAVNIDDKSAQARIALSYALQANFKIEDALKQARQATERDPNNALAWARVAELELSIPNYDKAKEAAEKAVTLNAHLARTQSVLGFANLTRIDIKAAKSNFERAIELDQSDPLSRLGLALAMIREGNLESGREQIEVAASLDPENSLIRSYLGKAYYEEKRDDKAAKQFALAKERDINDPTSYFYDAIRTQTENRPADALWNLQQSIARNDFRAPYRSKLLIDSDGAARGLSLARIYEGLGFNALGLLEATKSLRTNPSNSSPHRFLSEVYGRLPRHEIARASEFLQAQLLQPTSTSPVRPTSALADLDANSASSTVALGNSDFTPLFESSRPQIFVSGAIGNKGVLGDELAVSGVNNRLSYSFGQFHSENNGFRQNNDLTHDIYNAFLQYAVSTSFNIQAEIRRRNANYGDLKLALDPEAFSMDERHDLDQVTSRIGVHSTISPSSDVIASVIHNRRTDDQTITPGPIITIRLRDAGFQGEGAYIFRQPRFSLVGGLGSYSVDVDRSRQQDFTPIRGVSCPPGSTCIQESSFTRSQDNAYIYSTTSLTSNFHLLLGVSYQSFDEAPLKTKKTYPKLGLQWRVNDQWQVRLASFGIMKRSLVVDQTIEPTEIAGFNQFFDDSNGTQSRRHGIGIDARPRSNLYAGIEVSRRDVDVPGFVGDGSMRFDHHREKMLRAYLYWIPNADWTLTAEYISDKAVPDRAFEDAFGSVHTEYLPIAVRYFNRERVFAKLGATWVRQHVEQIDPELSNSGSKFMIVDALLGYRLPRRLGTVSIEAKNLFNRRFNFQDDNFRTSEDRSPPFVPSRTLMFRLTLVI
jgi:Tfp pilus assembly protein PilF